MKFLDFPQSGSVANETRSRNQFGQYVRARTAPTQPSSIFAVNARIAMAQAVARWNIITDSQREAWLGTERVRKDRLGREIVLSGRALFLHVNVPSRFYLAVNQDLPPPPPLFDLQSVTFSRVDTLGTVALTVDWSPAPATGLLLLFGTGEVNTGVTAFTTWGRALGWLNLDLTLAVPPFSGAPVDLNWVARFGPQPLSGGVSFFAWRQFQNGWLSPLVTSRVVTA